MMPDAITGSFILFFYLWNPSMQSANPVATPEFSSEERCVQAARRASEKFGGAMSKPIYFCAPK